MNDETAPPRIPDEWAEFTVPIDDVVLYPGNAKTHALEVIRSSLRKRGQYRLAVVQQGTNHVLVGNGMVEAARAEGWPDIAVHLLDVDDDDARELLLMDNRSAELGGFDNTALLALLEQTPNLTDTGYSDADLQALLAATVPPEAVAGERSDGTLLDLTDIAVGEPQHQVNTGDVWLLGELPHTLVVHQVHKDWPAWTQHLEPGMLLLPYAGPFAALTTVAHTTRLLLVQPDHYLAGHVLDKYAAVNGSQSVRRA